ncbi:MAG: alpha/beta hydrolase [Candidatus Hodarchaeota archaeon]
MKSRIRDLTFLDQPEILGYVFYPRRQLVQVPESAHMFSLKFSVENHVDIGGRFYLFEKKAPILLFFHGNGEIATDYDSIAPLYQQIGVNLCVADYRGYGVSTGSPSFTNMILDAHTIYHQFSTYLKENKFTGSVSVMGRSLGSASAVELATHYQNNLSCLIIESGFVHTYKLLMRLGVSPSILALEKQEDASLTPLLRKIRLPTLVIHGENDIIIPVTEGQAIYENISNLKKDLLLLPRAGHNDLLLRHLETYMKAVKNFIDNSTNVG